MEIEANSKPAFTNKREFSETENESLQNEFLQSEEKKVQIEGLRSFYKLRKLWSVATVTWISGYTFFHGFLVIGVGFKWLNFDNHPNFFYAIIVENSVQILGMAWLIIKYFHPTKAV